MTLINNEFKIKNSVPLPAFSSIYRFFSMTKIAIFASGSGTNAQNIIKTIGDKVQVTCIYCNNPSAGIIDRARNLGVEVNLFTREQLYTTGEVLRHLELSGAEYVILAGFLWLIPNALIAQYPDRIINIHPALLPNYGGKGMYGEKVHQSVINNKEKESGITIHLVNEKYDEGRHIFQAKCSIDPTDTAETLAHKIHQLEYDHFPNVILNFINNNKKREL